MSSNKMNKCLSGNQIAVKMISNAGKGNSEPKSGVKKETLTAGNISFIHSLAKSPIFSAGNEISHLSLAIGQIPSAGEK